MVGWLVGFSVYQPFSGLLNAELSFKQFSLVLEYFFVYKQLNVKSVQLIPKTILSQTFQFSTLFQCQTQIYFKQFSLV